MFNSDAQSLLNSGYKIRRREWGELAYIHKCGNSILTSFDNPVDPESKMFLKKDWVIVKDKNPLRLSYDDRLEISKKELREKLEEVSKKYGIEIYDLKKVL